MPRVSKFFCGTPFTFPSTRLSHAFKGLVRVQGLGLGFRAVFIIVSEGCRIWVFRAYGVIWEFPKIWDPNIVP